MLSLRGFGAVVAASTDLDAGRRRRAGRRSYRLTMTSREKPPRFGYGISANLRRQLKPLSKGTSSFEHIRRAAGQEPQVADRLVHNRRDVELAFPPRPMPRRVRPQAGVMSMHSVPLRKAHLQGDRRSRSPNGGKGNDTETVFAGERVSRW